MSKTYIRHFKDNFKLDLAYNGLINSNEIFEIINDEEICNNNDKEKEEQKQFNPLFDLIENYDYLIQILKSQDLNVIEYIYLNKYKIHKILYDKDSTIHVELDFMSEFPDINSIRIPFAIQDNKLIMGKTKNIILQKLNLEHLLVLKVL